MSASTPSVATTLLLDETSTPPTMTVTINPEHTNTSGGDSAGNSDSLSSGVVAAIVVVSVLVVICVVTAARLHLWWCMNLRCKACFIIRCGRRKLRRGRSWDKRTSSFTTRSFEKPPCPPEKSGGAILDRSPLDRHFLSNSEGGSTLIGSPRLQEIGGTTPRYFNPPSIVSNVALITIPDPVSISSAILIPPVSTANHDEESTEPAVEDENHPPSAFNTTLSNKARLRASNGSGLLSIITLPSFITNDRPRPYSSSAAVQLESPVQPQSHRRKQSSIFSQRFSTTNSSTPISPVSDGDTNGKGSRPTSSTLQIITSALKWNGSSSSRSSSPSSRRSSRRSLGRRNLSFGAEDEATIQWRKLPPIPPVQGASAMQNRDSQRTSGTSAERLPSFIEKIPMPPFSLAAQVPLPPSPSTMASSMSSLSYALPSPHGVPPINNFTTPYATYSYPPLPPSIPSTPGSFCFPPLPPSTPSTPGKSSYPPLPPSIPSTPGRLSYPPLPPSTPSTPGQLGYPPLPPSIPSTPSSMDRFTDVCTDTAADPLAINAIPDEVGRTQSGLNFPATTAGFVFPGNHDGPDNDVTGRSVYRQSRSSGSLYSQSSGIQELALPSRPLWAFPSSPPPPMSPRGPRPRPLPIAPTQLSRSGTLHSQTSSIGQ